MLKVYRLSYLSLILLTFISLTGSIYGINFKIILAAISSISLFFVLYSKGIGIDKGNIILFLWFIILSGFSVYMGFNNGFNSSFIIEEFIGVISPLIILSLYNNNFISVNAIKKTMILGATIFCIEKIVIVILLSMNVITFTYVNDLFNNVFGYQFVSMLISAKFHIIRVYVVNDVLITFMPILLFWNNRIRMKKSLTIFIYIVFCGSMFISFSRFLIAAFVIISFFPVILSFKITVKKVIISFYCFCITTILLMVYGIPKTISDRFSIHNTNNIQSDETRLILLNSIKKMISEYPIFGAGLGSSDLSLNRPDYVYELQWFSLTFKFGIPIFFIILIIIALYFWKNFHVNFKSTIVFCLMLSSGIFNPYLESTVMGVCILMLYSVYGKYQKTNNLIKLPKRVLNT